MFRDDISLPPSGMPAPLIHGYDEASASAPASAEHHLNDENNLDDIWGSAPASPTLSNVELNAEGFANGQRQAVHEVSDIPRLRSAHSTAGYREGISAAKNTTIQAGFDEGYSLGAVFGLRVGAILGLLEGVYSALTKSSEVAVEEKTRVKALVNKAGEELKTEEVFGREWWGEDGIWKFQVQKESKGLEVTFTDVADAHPLIQKWEAIVEEEVRKWRLDLRTLEESDVRRVDEDD